MLIGRSVPGTDMAAMMDLFAYMIGEAEKVAKGECVPTSWAARHWPVMALARHGMALARPA